MGDGSRRAESGFGTAPPPSGYRGGAPPCAAATTDDFRLADRSPPRVRGAVKVWSPCTCDACRPRVEVPACSEIDDHGRRDVKGCPAAKGFCGSRCGDLHV